MDFLKDLMKTFLVLMTIVVGLAISVAIADGILTVTKHLSDGWVIFIFVSYVAFLASVVITIIDRKMNS